MRAPGAVAMEQPQPLRNRLCRSRRDRIRMDSKQTTLLKHSLSGRVAHICPLLVLACVGISTQHVSEALALTAQGSSTRRWPTYLPRSLLRMCGVCTKPASPAFDLVTFPGDHTGRPKM